MIECIDCQELLTRLIDRCQEVPLVFADPPDNIGLDYGMYTDKRPDYYDWLELLIRKSLKITPCFWLSYYWKHDLEIKHRVRMILKYDRPSFSCKSFIWRFTFGQHNKHDFGSGFRFLMRLMRPGATQNLPRILSKRQELGDARANPDGRVPDDVWDYPRVVGNSSERRAWHPTQHPEALMERIISTYTNPGDQVVDLFGGSGTTGHVCKRLGRQYLISEIDPAYVQNMKAEGL